MPNQRPALPIDFPTALRLTLTANLDIAQARQVVTQARARLEGAQALVLPNFNLGSAYNTHEGNISKAEGNIIKVNRDSLFVGGGPSMTFQVADALFLPLVARQVVAATEAGQRRDQVRDALKRDLEAARFAVNRAFRQYDAADPANR